MIRGTVLAALACTLSLGLTACEKGPAERAGHKVDETVDTLKHGGHESIGNKAEDAMDKARDDAKDAADKARDGR
jgi:hypothetical protein